MGADAATYIGLGLAVLGLFWGGSKFFNIRINKKHIKKTTNNSQEQTLNVDSGNGLQAGRDMNINMNKTDSVEDIDKAKEKRAKKSNDLRVVEEMLSLIPYEETVHFVGQSYICGMPYDFARKLDRIEQFDNVRYQLFNSTVELSKLNFVKNISKFNSISAEFLGVDDASKEKLMVVPPYHWKYNGSEEIYRDLQTRLSDSADSVIEQYDNFIGTLKSEGFVSDKI